MGDEPPRHLVGPTRPGLDRHIEAFVATLGADSLSEFALTPLDTVGVPVWATWWNGEGSATGGIGYGLTEQRAGVGALGECVDHVCAATEPVSNDWAGSCPCCAS